MNKLATRLLSLSAVVMLAPGCTFVSQDIVRKQLYEPAKPQVVKVPRRDNGAIYQAGMRVGLFESTTARYVGDTLTIRLRESTNTSATSNTSSSKDQKVELPGPTLAGSKVTQDGREVLQNNVDAGREFNGQGTSAMSSTFSGMISVTVAEVLDNGYLLVRGQKLMLFNKSDEFIRFSGIVRPQDINPNNTIDSERVANVQVAYSGQGELNSSNTMGPLARFFQSKNWPY